MNGPQISVGARSQMQACEIGMGTLNFGVDFKCDAVGQITDAVSRESSLQSGSVQSAPAKCP
ncbi:hypothetical protein CP98_02174 [Sphingobium yanoikuyae]|uniref:Uncharacterized protein n=1 Tax=Sphingobium yanoikuyae TaxID=13690 RepID=A0A084EMS0_SPHYA|nr:hypothetical protein CP98_02174 [Sphingobium yanoikuyae]